MTGLKMSQDFRLYPQNFTIQMHFYIDTSQNNHKLTKGEFLLTPVVYILFTDVVRTVRNNGFTEGNFGKPTAMKTEGPVERFSLSIACRMKVSGTFRFIVRKSM